MLAINILKYLFGKASDFFMTLSHQRLSMQLVLAAAKQLKSSMCFSALINQGTAETNLKIKNIQKVEGETVSACNHAIFTGYSHYAALLLDDGIVRSSDVIARARIKLNTLSRTAPLHGSVRARPRAMSFSTGEAEGL